MSRQLQLRDDEGRRYVVTLDDDTGPMIEALSYLSNDFCYKSPSNGGKLAGCLSPTPSCLRLGIASRVHYPGRIEFICTIPPTVAAGVPRGAPVRRVEGDGEAFHTCGYLRPYWKDAAQQGRQKVPKKDPKQRLSVTEWGRKDQKAILSYLRSKCEGLVKLAKRLDESMFVGEQDRYERYASLARAAEASLKGTEANRDDVEALAAWLLSVVRREKPWYHRLH